MKRIIVTLIAAVLCTLLTAQNQTVVEKYGLLQVNNAHVTDKNGQFISLFGNSLFWSISGWGGDKFYNEDVVKFLKEDWNSSIVRATVANIGSAGEVAKMKAVVDACIAHGLYVIIDYHTHTAQNFTNQAVAFFEEMARTYGTYDNVIYEIFNEPLDVSWNTVIKPYAETVIAAIRAIDPDNLIIVGSRNWSQQVVEASRNPIDDGNVAYALHFYADTHGQWLRDAATTAMNNGIAIFVTEWGTCDASGNGGYNEPASNEWIDFCQENFISMCNWALNDKNETASQLKPGASATGGWTEEDYTLSGKYVRNLMRDWYIEGKPCNTVLLPNTIEAEDYCSKANVQKELCSEGGRNVSGINAGSRMSYSVTVEESGEFTVSYRIASPNGKGKIQLEMIDSDAEPTILGTLTLTETGGLQNWATVSHNVTLPAGTYDLRVFAPEGGFNLNWLKIMHKTEGEPVLTTITLFPSDTVVKINTSLRIIAQGFDQNGNPYPLDIEWSIADDKQGATIDQNGTFKATKTLDTYTVVAAHGDISASVEIMIFDPCPAKVITEGRIEAEDYCTMFNTQNETTTDTNGGLNIGYLVSNSSWLTYTINVPETGKYPLDFRVASLNKAGQMTILVDGVAVQTETFPKTGGWQTWETVSTFINLTEGDHELRFNIITGDFNINWFVFGEPGPVSVSFVAGQAVEVYPNPVRQGNLLHLSASSDVNRIVMTDLKGTVVHTQRIDGENRNLTIPTGGLSGGVYLLQVICDRKQEVHKVIVE